MIVHTVAPGDTLNAIAKRYGVSPESIIINNSISDPDRLVVGQTLVILYYGTTYTVEAGDTLEGIARSYGVSKGQLLRNNPVLRGEDTIYPGQTIVINYANDKRGEMAVNGYIYPFVDEETLRRTLPYLTYITVFSYGFTPEGELIYPDDDKVLGIISEYDAKPIMLLTTLGEDGTFSNELSSRLVNDSALQDVLIENVLKALREKGYYGLDIDFEYVYPQDEAAYSAFVKKLTDRLNAEGYPVIVALAPKTSSDQRGLLYEGHNYSELGNAANSVLIMTYEWGYTYGPPMAVAPINQVRRVLDYAVSEIDSGKIFMGMPNYGYDWTLPYVKGRSMAESVTNVEAVDIAANNRAAIEYDYTAQSPYFRYSRNGVEHEVWFEDARSVESKLALVPQYGLRGISYWNLMNYFPQSWLVLNALYDIIKV